MQPARADDQRMLGLDAFRGFASAAVLIYHYMHFVYVGDAASAAFASELKGFYLHGWLGVDSFFCLSGFIFGKLYGERIANGEVSGRAFFVARLSRLYPMFLATLLPCVVLLAIFKHQSGTNFLNQNHDTALAFVAELLLVRQWFSESFAFNRSAWSISVEVLMYLLFYLARRSFPRDKLMIPLAFVLLACVAQQTLFMPLGRGLFGFFLGLAAFEAMRMTAQSPRKFARPLGAGVLALALLVSLLGCYRVMNWRIERWDFNTIMFADLGFAALIVLASKINAPKAWLAALCDYAGRLSYPAYLIHFPLQVAIVLVARTFGFALPADKGWFFIGYMTLVLTMSAWAHHAFEIPAREWVRRRLRY